MATPSFQHGLKGTVSINGSSFAATNFSYKESTDVSDITYTNAGAATYGVQIPGYVTATGTVNFIYDAANKPYLSPLSLIAGALISPLVLNPDNSSPFSFNAYISNVNWSSGPKAGPIAVSFDYTSTGTITRPVS